MMHRFFAPNGPWTILEVYDQDGQQRRMAPYYSWTQAAARARRIRRRWPGYTCIVSHPDLGGRRTRQVYDWWHCCSICHAALLAAEVGQCAGNPRDGMANYLPLCWQCSASLY